MSANPPTNLNFGQPAYSFPNPNIGQQAYPPSNPNFGQQRYPTPHRNFGEPLYSPVKSDIDYPHTAENYYNHGQTNDFNNAGTVPGVPPNLPTAPDFSQMEKIPGYENLTGDNAILMPPSMPRLEPENKTRVQLPNMGSMSEEDIRDAVVQFVAEHCCYRSRPARDMQLIEINMLSGCHYKLETFAEKRQSAWKFLPFIGQAIDGPLNGPAPLAWDIKVEPVHDFLDSETKVEVPHTAFVKPCHSCIGNCRVRCQKCSGNGQDKCHWCNGRGRNRQGSVDEICTSCNGTGHNRCFTCNGLGQVKCKTCDGRGSLKGFVELTVTW